MIRTWLVAGIDPASTTGIIVLSVNGDRPGYEPDWRWVHAQTFAKSTRDGVTRAENELALFDKARDVLQRHRVDECAIERPADMEARRFRPGGQGQDERQQATGTSFGIGAAYGMCASAARAEGIHVTAYPATSRKANPAKGKLERVGWMPNVRGGKRGNLVHVIPRDVLLAKLHQRSITLRHQPRFGILRRDPTELLNENIRMALGVLLFHLSRQVR